MKRFVTSSVFALAVAFSASQARAGLIINVNIDEFGTNTTDYLGVPLHAFGSEFINDPSGGVAGQALFYLLPFATVQGDVSLTENVGNVTVVSDVLRFFTWTPSSQTFHLLILYSSNANGTDSLADISGLPSLLSGNTTTLAEGANGTSYAPGPGNPGYITADFSPFYNITSDSAVPEPGSVALIAAGLAGLGLMKKLLA